MPKKIKVFHIAKRKWTDEKILEALSKDFDYQWIAADYDFLADELHFEIFGEKDLNPKYGRALFVIEGIPDFIKKKPQLIVQLPAYQIFCEQSEKFSNEAARLLAIKGAYALDKMGLMKTIKFMSNYVGGQMGYKQSDSFVQPLENAKIKIEKKGPLFEIKGEFSKRAKQVLVWREIHPLEARQSWEFYPEVQVVSGDVDVFFKVIMIKNGLEEISEVRTVTMEEIKKRKKIFITNHSDLGVSFNISCFIRGENDKTEACVQVGQIHIRKVLLGESYMIPGAERIVDEENLGRELIFYFNPGDLKPPLAVYFSGFRSAEGFEGRGMMAGMKCPYILVGDPRLFGGAYYMGSKSLEDQLAAKIQEKLTLLGFSHNDLMLSGLSMGTYGSLYYSKDLRPHAVILGKPLASIGDAMLWIHVNRPGADPIHDILYAHMGAADEEASMRFNDRFWDKFKEGDYSETTFAIAYMKEDDIDWHAYPMLSETIKEISPHSKILYKGLTGRHNDDTPGIVAWFLKQYYSILENDFHRPRDRGLDKMKEETQKEILEEAEDV